MFKKAFSHPPNPTRAKTRAFPWQGRSERGGETYRGPVALSDATGDRYVEPLSDARTQLEAFFNILLERRAPVSLPFRARQSIELALDSHGAGVSRCGLECAERPARGPLRIVPHA